MKNGIELILEERERQIKVLGWSTEHDVKMHADDGLAIVAGLYALPSKLRNLDNSFVGLPKDFPWERQYWKPSPENRIRELKIAGALIAAEIDRLQYKQMIKLSVEGRIGYTTSIIPHTNGKYPVWFENSSLVEFVDIHLVKIID